MIFRTLATLALAFSVVGCSAAVSKSASANAVKEKVPMTTPVRIVLVGDSTVTVDSGWGAGFAKLAGPNVKVSNYAAKGRSSKSYRDEGWWDKALAEGGDYMLIQFGHNDQPGKGPERETDPETTFKENLKRYVAEAKAKGFKPILVTSLIRRKFKDDGVIHSDLQAYADGTRHAAAEAGVPLIDLHDRSLAYFNQLGQAECDKNNPTDKTGKADTTHLSKAWYEPVGRLVLEDLLKVSPDRNGLIAFKYSLDVSDSMA
jgi:pectinesterase